jgi:Domain of unknown function (DUF4157)
MSDRAYAKTQAQQKTLIRSSPKSSLLQRTRADTAVANSSVPPVVHTVLNSGGGQPLDPATRAFMEPRFGHDFSQVRVHTDARAAQSVRAVNAIAYTAGSNVVFGPGRYEPSSIQGRSLLAHELTHVLQQRASVQLPEGVGHVGDQYEQHADAVAH